MCAQVLIRLAVNLEVTVFKIYIIRKIKHNTKRNKIFFCSTMTVGSPEWHNHHLQCAMCGDDASQSGGPT